MTRSWRFIWDLEIPDSPLAAREAEVLRRFAAGAGPAEIAALFLSNGTVRNYLASAVTKLGARNRGGRGTYRRRGRLAITGFWAMARHDNPGCANCTARAV